MILLGGGGHCKSVIDVAESAGYNILGILDMPEDVGNQVLDYKVIGTDDDIPLYVDMAEFVITVGFIKNPATRIKLYNKVKEAGGKLATIIASTARVSKYSTIGEGTVVLHQAFVNAGAHIGANCIINTFCNIEHDAQIGDQCHILQEQWLMTIARSVIEVSLVASLSLPMELKLVMTLSLVQPLLLCKT